MKFDPIDPPREYTCGYGPQVTMRDCARLRLEADEQVTMTTPDGAEYDLARKSWGFYATPSINGRLQRFGLQTALVRNRVGQYFVMLVEQGHEAGFEQYVTEEGLALCGWLNDDTLPGIAELMENGSLPKPLTQPQ